MRTAGRARRNRAPAPVWPSAIQRAYYGDLLQLVKWCKAQVDRDLLPYLPALLEEHAKADSAGRLDRAPAAQRVLAILAAAKYAFLDRFPTWKTERLLRKYAARTSQHQKIQLHRQIKQAVGIPLSAVIDKGLTKTVEDFTAANVSLITTIPEQYFNQVQTTVLEGLQKGARAEELAGDVQDRFGVAKSRAYLIARDQIGKFTGELNKVRQTNLGVKKFVWMTVSDERVRDSHAALDGGEFDWDNLPEGDEPDASPGSEINCRCWSSPIVDFD